VTLTECCRARARAVIRCGLDGASLAIAWHALLSRLRHLLDLVGIHLDIGEPGSTSRAASTLCAISWLRSRARVESRRARIGCRGALALLAAAKDAGS